MTTRALLQIPLLVCLAALACQKSNTIAGPSPAGPTATPTPPPVSLAGDWVGIYQGDPHICQSFNLAAATATFTESASTLAGNLTSTQGNCPTAVRIQAIRSGNTFSGTASQLGYTGTVSGRFDGTSLDIVVSALSNGTSSVPSGTAQLHRP